MSQLLEAIGSEQGFDRAIALDNLDMARSQITGVVGALRPQTKWGLYPKPLFRAALKEVAFPLYVRASDDLHGREQSAESQDVARVSQDAVKLLEFLKRWHDSALMKNPNDPLITQLKGDMTETTIFALTTRPLEGKPTDVWNVVPTSRERDRFNGAIRRHAFNNNIDFLTTERQVDETLLVQAKTSKPRMGKPDYDPSITVVELSKIAGGYQRIPDLQEALIGEVAENVSLEELTHIEESWDRLEQLYYSRLGSPAVQASQL